MLALTLIVLTVISIPVWPETRTTDVPDPTGDTSNTNPPTQAYVSDQLNIALRSGASTEHRIIRFIKSGTPMSVVARSKDETWASVILLDQTQGWVSARYLMAQPSARSQLRAARTKIQSLQDRIKASNQASNETQSQSTSLKQQLNTLNEQYKSLTQEHQQLQTLCEDAQTIGEENLQLREQLSDHKFRVNELENINTILRHDQRNEGILKGAIAAVIGALIALLAPKLMRRSNRDVWR